VVIYRASAVNHLTKHISHNGIVWLIPVNPMLRTISHAIAQPIVLSQQYRRNRKLLEQGRLWWPPNMSNCLIALSFGYYVNDCLRHPPVGSSRASLSLCNLAMGLGFALRHLYAEPFLPAPRKRKRK
jgi:hypothetical protein